MTSEIANYENGAQNAEIPISGSEIFFSLNADMAAKSQFGSFNNLEIVNDSANDLFIDLDGLTTRRRTLFAKSTMVIKAEQGIYFNNVKVTNKSAAAVVSASAISLLARIVRRV